MLIERLALQGAFRIHIEKHEDERGFFARTFCAEEFAKAGLKTDFVQHSISVTKMKGTIRGLHFQSAPGLETKLIRCSRGSAFDVMVDLRQGSPSFGHWHGEILSAQNAMMLYVPAGFAHGLQTLQDDTEMDYQVTPAYQPDCATGVRWNDPTLAIRWPLDNPFLSPRDKTMPMLKDIKPLSIDTP